MATNAQDDIGPQGLLDHVESEIAQVRDYLASDEGNANLARERLQRTIGEAVQVEHLGTGTFRVAGMKAGEIVRWSNVKASDSTIEREEREFERPARDVAAAAVAVSGVAVDFGAHMLNGDSLHLTVDGVRHCVPITEHTILKPALVLDMIDRIRRSSICELHALYQGDVRCSGLTFGWVEKPAEDEWRLLQFSGGQIWNETTLSVSRRALEERGWHMKPMGLFVSSNTTTKGQYIVTKPPAPSTVRAASFDPPPVTGVPITVGTGIRLGDDGAPELSTEPEKPTSVVEEFGSIRRRMDEIRALEGRQAPA